MIPMPSPAKSSLSVKLHRKWLLKRFLAALK